MAVDRLDVTPPSASPSRTTDAIGPATGDPRVDAPFAVGGIGAAGVRRALPVDESQIDPVEEVAALAAGRPVAGAAGLAAQLLDYITPRPRNADALLQPRIVPLLGAAADRVGSLARTPHDTDVLDSVGIRALQQELENHRELAERRANRLEP